MIIYGEQVVLRPATEQDKRIIYEWSAKSDITASIMGPPLFPDHPIPTWEEFCADYKPHYFDDSAPELGRCFVILVDDMPVGQINYNGIDKHNHWTGLDIWMSCEANCGKGYGPDAIKMLCEYLLRDFGVIEFVIEPSARNSRAIRAYEKAGFRRISLSPEEIETKYSHRDYYDGVWLIKQTS